MTYEQVVELTTITDSTGLLASESEWRELESEAPGTQYFQTYDWVAAWWKDIGSAGPYGLRVLMGRTEGKLLFVWPLVIEHNKFYRTLTTLGGILASYSDVLAATKAETGQWVNLAIREVDGWSDYDIIRLDEVRSDAVLTPHLDAWLGPPVRQNAAVHVDCQAYGSFDAFLLASMSGKQRQNNRRVLKALKARGAISIKTDDGGADLDRLLITALNFKKDWLQARGLAHAVLEQDVAAEFLINVARAGQKDGKTIMTRVELDGTLIALGLGFLFNGRFNYYLGSFDQSLQEFGPGRTQMEETIRWCFDRGIAVYDMLPPDTEFKAVWTKTKAPTFSYMSGRGFKGKFWGSFYPRRIRPLLKQAYNSLPGNLRRLSRRVIGEGLR